jgi:hypothetical protein
MVESLILSRSTHSCLALLLGTLFVAGCGGDSHRIADPPHERSAPHERHPDPQPKSASEKREEEHEELEMESEKRHEEEKREREEEGEKHEERLEEIESKVEH